MQERRRLRVPNVGEGLPLRDGGPGGAEGAGPLGLLDAGTDDRNARGGDGDERVDEGRVVVDAEVMEIPRDAARIGPVTDTTRPT
jgi:hypothetical protein